MAFVDRIRLFAAFSFLALHGGLCSSASASHALDPEIKFIMDEWAVPGIAVAVVKDGVVVFAQGYGVNEIGADDKVNTETIFGIGSMTKSFTGTAAAMMVDEGKFAWDQPAIDILPQLQFDDPWITTHATLRDLAAHRVGIDGDAPWIVHSWSMEETFLRTRYLKPLAPFGSFLYSNTGILALGRAVENSAGMSWHKFIQDRIFAPLGMARSSTGEFAFVKPGSLATCWLCQPPPGYAIGKAALKDTVANVAAPHGLTDETIVVPGKERQAEVWPWRYEGSIAPAGTINSSVNDMTKWLLLHLNKGKVNGKQILGEEQVREIHSFSSVTETKSWRKGDKATEAEKTDWLNGMGLGWQTKFYRGHRASNHSGGQVGFGSIMWLFHEENLGVVVLNNLDYRHSRGHLAVARLLVDHYLNLPKINWNQHYKDGWKSSFEGRTLPIPEKKLHETHADETAIPQGRYYNPAMGTVKIRSDSTSVVLEFEPTSVADLYSANKDQFVAVFRSGEKWRMSVDMLRDDGGKITGFVLGRRGGAQQQLEFRIQN